MYFSLEVQPVRFTADTKLLPSHGVEKVRSPRHQIVGKSVPRQLSTDHPRIGRFLRIWAFRCPGTPAPGTNGCPGTPTPGTNGCPGTPTPGTNGCPGNPAAHNRCPSSHESVPSSSESGAPGAPAPRQGGSDRHRSAPFLKSGNFGAPADR